LTENGYFKNIGRHWASEEDDEEEDEEEDNSQYGSEKDEPCGKKFQPRSKEFHHKKYLDLNDLEKKFSETYKKYIYDVGGRFLIRYNFGIEDLLYEFLKKNL